MSLKIAEIDSKNAFDFNIKKQWNVEDKASWEKEQKVESVIEDLLELENIEEGKVIAEGLKLKYWSGISNHELVVNIRPLKTSRRYNKCMNNLQEFGYITYLPSSNPFMLSIVYLKGL